MGDQPCCGFKRQKFNSFGVYAGTLKGTVVGAQMQHSVACFGKGIMRPFVAAGSRLFSLESSCSSSSVSLLVTIFGDFGVYCSATSSGRLLIACGYMVPVGQIPCRMRSARRCSLKP